MHTKYSGITALMMCLLFYVPASLAAELIHSIDDAYYNITQTNPPQLHVVARGYVESSGWGFPQLVPYLKQKPPADGVLEYDFIARAPGPDRLVTRKLLPIGANNLLHDYYPSIKSIKINAKTNSKTLTIVPPAATEGWSTDDSAANE